MLGLILGWVVQKFKLLNKSLMCTKKMLYFEMGVSKYFYNILVKFWQNIKYEDIFIIYSFSWHLVYWRDDILQIWAQNIQNQGYPLIWRLLRQNNIWNNEKVTPLNLLKSASTSTGFSFQIWGNGPLPPGGRRQGWNWVTEGGGGLRIIHTRQINKLILYG